jgi:hypothetical protein
MAAAAGLFFAPKPAPLSLTGLLAVGIDQLMIAV